MCRVVYILPLGLSIKIIILLTVYIVTVCDNVQLLL